MSELINTESDTTIGIMEMKEDEETYVPVICWNLSIVSYVSDPDSSFRAYGCDVKIRSMVDGVVKTFRVFIKENDFFKFERVRPAIVAQTHGELIMNSKFDPCLWSDFVPRLLFDSRLAIKHQRPARNIGLQWNYLKKKAFNFGGAPQLEHVEIVYRDIVYNGKGEVLEAPVNTLVPDAFPSKNFRVSPFKPSGLRGFLQHFLPPYTSTSKFRRDQQNLANIGATGK